MHFIHLKARAKVNNPKLILVKKNTVNSTDGQVRYNMFLPAERRGKKRRNGGGKESADNLGYCTTTFGKCPL